MALKIQAVPRDIPYRPFPSRRPLPLGAVSRLTNLQLERPIRAKQSRHSDDRCARDRFMSAGFSPPQSATVARDNTCKSRRKYLPLL
jgi:hypothetical protein